MMKMGGCCNGVWVIFLRYRKEHRTRAGAVHMDTSVMKRALPRYRLPTPLLCCTRRIQRCSAIPKRGCCIVGLFCVFVWCEEDGFWTRDCAVIPGHPVMWWGADPFRTHDVFWTPRLLWMQSWHALLNFSHRSSRHLH